MRRHDKAITDRQAIDAILHEATVLYLGLQEEGVPYVVPMHFGYDGTALYLHSALEGRKMAILRRDPRVCFAVSLDNLVVQGEVGCRWFTRFRSVIGYGDVAFLDDPDEKQRALDLLLGKFAAGPFTYQEASLARTAVLRIIIREISGKQAE